jgi:hypothetical protein
MPASKKQKRKTKRVMKEYKRGTLKSGGRRKVKSRKQAIAIAMSEAGQSYKRKRKSPKRKMAKRKAVKRMRAS